MRKSHLAVYTFWNNENNGLYVKFRIFMKFIESTVFGNEKTILLVITYGKVHLRGENGGAG